MTYPTTTQTDAFATAVSACLPIVAVMAGLVLLWLLLEYGPRWLAPTPKYALLTEAANPLFRPGEQCPECGRNLRYRNGYPDTLTCPVCSEDGAA